MPLTPKETTAVLKAARSISISAPSERVEQFIGRALGLNAIIQSQYFPSPDPQGSLSVAISQLTKLREDILNTECTIPEYTVYYDALQVPHISGFSTYLAVINTDTTLRGRLAHYKLLETELRKIKQGHDLEAVAAAIMNVYCDYGEATQGSGDQGIDAIGWNELVLIETSFTNGSVFPKEILPGEKVFLFASSKAFMFKKPGAPKVINPSHIRELVGGWVIQRSTAGKWQKAGIRTLSPVQMILVTTYRLSVDSKAECRLLGVQVWGIPELIYLICRTAPPSVFDASNNFFFSSTEFRKWWKKRDNNRISPFKV